MNKDELIKLKEDLQKGKRYCMFLTNPIECSAINDQPEKSFTLSTLEKNVENDTKKLVSLIEKEIETAVIDLTNKGKKINGIECGFNLFYLCQLDCANELINFSDIYNEESERTPEEDELWMNYIEKNIGPGIHPDYVVLDYIGSNYSEENNLQNEENEKLHFNNTIQTNFKFLDGSHYYFVDYKKFYQDINNLGYSFKNLPYCETTTDIVKFFHNDLEYPNADLYIDLRTNKLEEKHGKTL